MILIDVGLIRVITLKSFPVRCKDKVAPLTVPESQSVFFVLTGCSRTDDQYAVPERMINIQNKKLRASKQEIASRGKMTDIKFVSLLSFRRL